MANGTVQDFIISRRIVIKIFMSQKIQRTTKYNFVVLRQLIDCRFRTTLTLVFHKRPGFFVKLSSVTFSSFILKDPPLRLSFVEGFNSRRLTF